MPVRAIFLWHLHQPEYRDALTGQPLLPWVRMHATRAYTDMAAALERHERVRGVANWAPSLLLQLEAYVAGRAVDKDETIARKPVDSLPPAERAHVLKESFSVDWDLWVKPVPRYADLLARRGSDLRRVDLLRSQDAFTDQELIDLEVHFILGWMGFAARREEPLVAELVKKERLFTEAEKLALLDAQRRIAGKIVPRWSALAKRGQVELTCSPMYHPILPLLIDSDSARRAMPDATLPPRFHHPEDAREQVLRGLAHLEKTFGVRPVGIWPSEGSVSPEVLELFGQCALSWCATDQGILERSEVTSAPRTHTVPWMCGSVAMFFRDRDLSDRIGFRYARAEPKAAVEDLLSRVGAAPDGSTVTLALDGENPWEHYPRSGEEFLDALYSALEREAHGVRAVLPRDLLRESRPAGAVSRLHSGSWIDANFRIWIGHPEDNQAWTLLGQARAVLAHAEREGRASPEQLERAREAALAAEGSDWFWWYGDDFQTENAPEFDALFRANVAQIYRQLGLAVPDRLGKPIIASHKDRTQAQAIVTPPRRLIQPLIDGHAYGFYEWSGAGTYRPGASVGGSMYQGSGVFAQLWFGFSPRDLFLRLDPMRGADWTGELRILLSREGPTALSQREEKLLRMPLRAADECRVADERGRPGGEGRCGSIVEIALPLKDLGFAPGDRFHLLVRLLREDAEADRLPRYGDLELEVPDESFERVHWHV